MLLLTYTPPPEISFTTPYGDPMRMAQLKADFISAVFEPLIKALPRADGHYHQSLSPSNPCSFSERPLDGSSAVLHERLLATKHLILKKDE